KDIIARLSQAYGESLKAMCDDVERSGAREVAVVLAGGGANFRFVNELVQKKKPPRSKVRIRILPTVPAWAHDSVFNGTLAPLFPQLSIAIGGAIASSELLSSLT